MTEPDHDVELVERLCRIQHDAYETAAAELGWSTQQASRVPWDEVPPANQATMRASMRAVLAELGRPRQLGADFEFGTLDDTGAVFVIERRGEQMFVAIPRRIWAEWGRPVTIHAHIAPTQDRP